MHHCEKCGEELSDECYFCTKCGKGTKKLEAEMVCDVCGTEIEKGHTFCTVCGANIADDKYRTEAERQNNHTILILFLILILFIMIFGGTIWWMIN